MWELIRANRRKSMFLFFGMGIVLLLLGFIIGYAAGGTLETAYSGVVIATIIWFVMSLVGHFSGSSILLSSSNAVEVERDAHPRLFNVVEEMTLAAGLSKMPRVYIIQSNALNAFATGRNPENSAIAVTAGLLAVANRDELQGVVAHEMSHILNRDIRFMTFAGIMLGSIVLISQIFMRSVFYSSAARYRGSSKNSGGGQLIMMGVAILFAILAPIAAQMLYFAISRKREYLADASAVKLTRYPEGLASALEKIAYSTADLETANKVTAPMFIANPLKASGERMRNLSSTHPPIDERIRILRKLAGASYTDYQNTFREVTNSRSGLLPGSALTDQETIPLRKAGDQPSSMKIAPDLKSPEFRHAAGDIIMASNGFRFVNCGCGMKLKIPPGFSHPAVKCSSCGTVHKLRS
jgi:heat shock protein HtpX